MIQQQTDKDQKLIKALQTTIEAQKESIEAMKNQNAILKQRQKAMASHLDSLTDEQLDDMKQIINTYISGLRKL